MDADLGVGSSAALFPFDFQTAVSTASEDVAAECAGGEEQKPKIALTFDDGPNIKYTPMLLDGLKERGIKATFFSDRSKHRTRRKQKNRKKNV